MDNPAKEPVRRAAAWSESAFHEVYSRYIKPVKSYIQRRIGNHHDAEDIAAHVFAQALRHLEPKEVGAPALEAWLFNSARNASANHQRRKFVATISIEEAEIQQADTEDYVDEGLADELNLKRLTDAINRLPDEQRRALLLRFVEELPHAEVARALGRTENSARVLIHRTLATLRKKVS